MTAVRMLAPNPGDVELEALLANLIEAPALEPFGEPAISACDAIARALLSDPSVRHQPDLVALASWLRRANVTRLLAGAQTLGLRAPRGLVLHVPPANVEAMAMYSLALSILAGNRNVVRISSRAGTATARICAAITEALAAPALADVSAGTALLGWGHEPAPMKACARVCDVRVLWGGDETVQSLRAVPTAPNTRDVTFVDRFSMAAINAPAWADASPSTRDELASRLYNDAYWYDQQGCSSPRLIVWCGSRESGEAASADLFDRLYEHVKRRRYELPLGAITSKQAWLAGAAIDRPVARVQRWGNALAVLTLDTLDGLDRSHPGAGTFFQAYTDALEKLALHVTGRDQTLAVFGFDRGTLERFVRRAAGRGIDRIVPLGAALTFAPHWDGMDLFSELTRAVTIAQGAAHLEVVAA